MGKHTFGFFFSTAFMFPAFLREMGAEEYRLPLKCTVRNTTIRTSGELAAGSWWRGCQGMGGVGDEHVPSPRGGRRSPHAGRCQCVNTGLLLPESSFFFFFSREAGNQDIYGKSPHFRVLVSDVLFKTNKTACWPTTTWAPNRSQRCGQRAPISLNHQLPLAALSRC